MAGAGSRKHDEEPTIAYPSLQTLSSKSPGEPPQQPSQVLQCSHSPWLSRSLGEDEDKAELDQSSPTCPRTCAQGREAQGTKGAKKPNPQSHTHCTQRSFQQMSLSSPFPLPFSRLPFPSFTKKGTLLPLRVSSKTLPQTGAIHIGDAFNQSLDISTLSTALIHISNMVLVYNQFLLIKSTRVI